jgi:SPP1 gp7 family putative phage head morphogenesis protein
MIRLGSAQGTVAHFDSSHIEQLQRDVGEQLERAANISAKGIGVSYNEVLEQQGVEVEQPEEGDRKWGLATLIDLDAPEPEPEPEAPEGQAPEDDADEAPEDGTDEQASRTTLADKERVDEVYAAWRKVVNMSASSLEAWGETECSRKASLNPGAVIERNAALMRKKKSEWGSREVKAANRAISFISRMRGMPKGKPVGDCPSKRDISLKNWGYNPGAGRNSLESNDGGQGCCGEGAGETAASERDAGSIYAHLWDEDAVVALTRHPGIGDYVDKQLYQDALGWIEDYEKAQLAKLRRIATGSFRRLSIFDENLNPEALPPEAWAAILLDTPKWAENLDTAVRARLAVVFAEAMKDAAGELGVGVVSSTDPLVIQRIATQRIGLVEGVNSVTERRVRNAMAGVFTKLHPAGNLRQVVQQALPELTEELRRVFGSKEARARTIADTEAGKAVNQGKFTQYEASNVKSIRWKASNDSIVRPSHAAANGLVRNLGEAYPNGLRYPHDPNGGAAEVINCRCEFAVAERIDPLDDPDIEIA